MWVGPKWGKASFEWLMCLGKGEEEETKWGPIKILHVEVRIHSKLLGDSRPISVSGVWVLCSKTTLKMSKVFYIEKWPKYFFLGIRYKKNPKFFATVVEDANLFVVRLVRGVGCFFSLSLFFPFRIKFFLSSSYCSVVQEELEKKSKVLYIEKEDICIKKTFSLYQKVKCVAFSRS